MNGHDKNQRQGDDYFKRAREGYAEVFKLISNIFLKPIV